MAANGNDAQWIPARASRAPAREMLLVFKRTCAAREFLWHNLKLPMTTPVPFDVFSPELSPGETIQWTGRPNPRVIFHRDDALMIPFSLMWGGFAIFWLMGATGMWDVPSKTSNHAFSLFAVIWGTPFVLAGQYLIWGRFLYAFWKKKRTYYAVTNRRALIVEQGLRNQTARSAFFESLSTIDKSVRADGIGSIAFGGPVTSQWQFGKNNPPRPPTFEDVDGAAAVYQIAISMQDQKKGVFG
jgi:hypothetical protein